MGERVASGGVTPSFGGRELLAALPELSTGRHPVEVHDISRVSSSSLTFAELARTWQAIRTRFDDGVDGAVVTQGTDTIEEVSWLLDLLHTGPQPVVVTGAMRNPTQAGADGAANLLAALQVAAAPGSRGLGCLVVLGDEIHAARSVRKTHTMSMTAFTSPGRGPVGQLAEGRPQIWARSARLALPALDPLRQDADRLGSGRIRVVVAPVALDDDAFGIRAAVEAALRGKVHGIVVAALGAGHVPPAGVELLGLAAEQVPVVLASRTGAGPVAVATYGYPGSEVDLLGRGLHPAGHLDPFKARILLQLLLLSGAGADEIREAFAIAGGTVQEE